MAYSRTKLMSKGDNAYPVLGCNELEKHKRETGLYGLNEKFRSDTISFLGDIEFNENVTTSVV